MPYGSSIIEVHGRCVGPHGRSGGHGSALANHRGFTKKELLGIFCAACSYNCHYLSTASKRHLIAETTAIDLSVPLENPDRTFLCYMMYLHHSLRQKDPGHIFPYLDA